MRAALLSLGPSLARLYEPPPANILIGVKKAAKAFRCDWACVLDSPSLLLLDTAFAGRPRLLTRRAYRPKYTQRDGLDVEAFDGFCPVRHDDYTACAALVLAGYLGATTIDCYGVDWTDAPDFDGETPPEVNRTPTRWARERAQWDGIVTWLHGRGAEVRRL